MWLCYLVKIVWLLLLMFFFIFLCGLFDCSWLPKFLWSFSDMSVCLLVCLVVLEVVIQNRWKKNNKRVSWLSAHLVMVRLPVTIPANFSHNTTHIFLSHWRNKNIHIKAILRDELGLMLRNFVCTFHIYNQIETRGTQEFKPPPHLVWGAWINLIRCETV